MASDNVHAEKEPGIGRTLRDDLRGSDFRRTIPREFRDLRDFMLDEERRKRLQDMNFLKRWILVAWWLLKALVLKLTPIRRILLVIGLVLVVFRAGYSQDGQDVQVNFQVAGVLILLFVLALELKDKLVARKELEAGHAVQEALMPERTPHVAGWSVWLYSRSAIEVGGDLVDFLRLDENRYGTAVADVAGKGLSAALLSAKLQAMLRVFAPDFKSLAELGSKLNQVFCRVTLRNVFASLVYVELRPNSGTIRLLNAGHPPPVIVRGTSVQKLDKGGPALGIMHTAVYDEQHFELSKDDVLLVYSDGITEARNGAGEFYGEQRLLHGLQHPAGVSAKVIGESLIAEIDRFVGEAQAHDDLTIAVLRRE